MNIQVNFTCFVVGGRLRQHFNIRRVLFFDWATAMIHLHTTQIDQPGYKECRSGNRVGVDLTLSTVRPMLPPLLLVEEIGKPCLLSVDWAVSKASYCLNSSQLSTLSYPLKKQVFLYINGGNGRNILCKLIIVPFFHSQSAW